MQAVKWYQDANQITVELEPDQFAVVKYKKDGDVLHITSTRIPDELQGKGFGKVMMESVLPEIERAGCTIVPVCSYVVHYMNRQPQWSHLLADKA
ncbi:Acetyltransferase [Vibrio chagasii]|nr:Acetyltransferase [Vibrio chagasii]CAH7051294.1 Acetyltransferase [Vibrio chagasii]CAH7063148.1 Acetyltransferase [Vibrio chagasii]CAH7176419.1 Acetyltransferase [Vibrio chagasii]CAH7186126.1 Acetyltransferase [Vibrio chagasii]